MVKVCQSMGRFWGIIPADRIYLALMLVFGVICLTVTGGWKTYLAPLRECGRMLVFGGNLGGGQEELYGKTGMDISQSDGDNYAGHPDNGNPDSTASHGAETEDRVSQGVETQSYEEQTEFHYETVGDEYFADAVFIGDSRTVGLYEYGELQDISAFYASTGLTVHKLFTAEIVEVPGQKKKITVEEALSGRQFAKIYLMIGINEMGTGTVESFLQAYEESVAHLKELQPDAVIYLQGIMQVTTERSAQGDYITNEGIDIRNEGIAALADNETIFYLDVNEVVCDEDGAMISGYTYDGVHLKAQYITLWKDYLKNHAVELP